MIKGKNLRTVIIVGVVIVIAFIAYSYFFTAKPASVLTTSEVSGTPPVDQDLISLLAQLKAITLDDSIFNDPTFMSLQDFSQNLTPEPSGRINPFAPLGQTVPSGK